MGKFIGQTILKSINFEKEEIQMTSKYKSLLNILSYKGNENQDCIENPFRPVRTAVIRKNKFWCGNRKDSFRRCW